MLNIPEEDSVYQETFKTSGDVEAYSERPAAVLAHERNAMTEIYRAAARTPWVPRRKQKVSI